MKPRIHVFAIAVFCTVAHCHGQGSLITGHFGAADPTTEGFTLLREGNPSLTPVTADLGMNAWSINLNSSSDIAQYSRRLTAQQQADLAGGWSISLTLRVLAAFNSPNNGISAGLHTGTEYFSLHLGAESNGDPSVLLGNLSYTLAGGGSGYHNYQLRYDSGADVASLWIDGAERLTGLTGSFSPLLPQFLWGGGQHPPTGVHANWNEASLSAIPEPSLLALFCCGGLFLAACLRRRGPKC